MRKPGLCRTTLAVVVVLVGAILAATADAAPITVRVYDGSGTAPAVRDAAIDTATVIFADAGLDATWQDCTPRDGASSCNLARGPRDLMLRIMPTATTMLRGSTSALATRIEGNPVVLGFAIVEADTSAGVLATIFMDRVAALSARTGVAAGALLGRAMAHEVGHLLLGDSGHSAAGLMRAVWTDAELASDRADHWRFAPADRQILRGQGSRAP